MTDISGRKAVNAHTTPFLPYDLEGPVQPEMSWLPISYDEESGQGTYLMRMDPGAVTIAHDHAGMEEFLIIEGDLVDSDGTRFGPGDFVSYDAGTHHNSWTEGGCLIAVFEWRTPENQPNRRRYGSRGKAAAFRDLPRFGSPALADSEPRMRGAARPRSSRLQGSSRSRICARRSWNCGNEKGGVVRRPFSKLQAYG